MSPSECTVTGYACGYYHVSCTDGRYANVLRSNMDPVLMKNLVVMGKHVQLICGDKGWKAVA